VLNLRSGERLTSSDHLNLVLLVVSIYSLFVAVAAYRDAQSSGEDQLKALAAARQAIIDTGTEQAKTLSDSRKSLESVLSTLQQQEQVTRESLKAAQQQQLLLSKSLETSESQLTIIREQLRVATDKPDLEATLGLWQDSLRVSIHNKSLTKPALNISVAAHLFDVSPNGFMQNSYAIPTLEEIIPNGNYGPAAIDFWVDPRFRMKEGWKLFGYVTLQCVDCAVFKTYWTYFEVGKVGYYREGKLFEFNVWGDVDGPHPTAKDIRSFVDSLIQSEGVIPMRLTGRHVGPNKSGNR